MRKIVYYGDPVLVQKAAQVEVFDQRLIDLVAEMHDTMIKANGVGLAAPQIGVSKQVAIVDLSGGEDPHELHILINSEIIQIDGIQKGEEGCLSFPDIVTVVERPNYVKIKGVTLSGRPTEFEGEELLARAFCHEIDHLNGVLMTDRVSTIKREMIKRKVQKRIKAGQWQ